MVVLQLKETERFPGSGGALPRIRAKMSIAKVGRYLPAMCIVCRLQPQIECRLKWSKAYARKAQWNEEVILLKEEMRAFALTRASKQTSFVTSTITF